MRKNNVPKTYEDDLNAVEKTKKNFLWVQEFSKKIIVVLFLIYVVYNIISMLILLYTAKNGMISGFEVLTTEINETFRLIVGGYLVKAGFENVTKIGGSYYDNISKIKLAKIRAEQGVEVDTTEDDFNSNVEESTLAGPYGPGELS